jgi:hypothetical protein
MRSKCFCVGLWDAGWGWCEKNLTFLCVGWYEFCLPLGSYVDTCTSFYVFSGPRWLVGWIGYWTPIELPHCLSVS